MRLALTMRVVIDPRHGERRDALSHDWSEFVMAFWPDSCLLALPNQPSHVESWAEALAIHGAILSNGNDWGETPERDESERALVQWCRRHRRPILGVCRGLQAINVIFGGTIERDITSSTGESHAGITHRLALISPLFAELAGGKSLAVNSFHNQGVVKNGLASELRAFALTAGQVVEGLYHPEEPILAIQWHPERPNPGTNVDEVLLRHFFTHGAFWLDRTNCE